jgi:hypothetical protein
MTERKDFDLQGGSAAQGSGEKCTEGRQNRGWGEPAQVSHFQLHPSLRDAQTWRKLGPRFALGILLHVGNDGSGQLAISEIAC